MTKRWMYLIAGLVLAMAAGCHRGPPPGANYAEDYPVHGKVVFAGGTPLKGGVIYFTPVEIKDGRKVRWEGSSLVDGNGDYKINYGGGGPGKGLPAGEYKVRMEPREINELPGSNANWIPKQYQDKTATPLTVTVKEEDNTFDFELR